MPLMTPVEPDRIEEIAALFCAAHSLTPRERQIIGLMCSGAKNLSIAMQLGVSEATVRLHITNIHRKLKTDNKVDLILQMFGWWLNRTPAASCTCGASPLADAV